MPRRPDAGNSIRRRPLTRLESGVWNSTKGEDPQGPARFEGASAAAQFFRDGSARLRLTVRPYEDIYPCSRVVRGGFGSGTIADGFAQGSGF